MSEPRLIVRYGGRPHPPPPPPIPWGPWLAECLRIGREEFGAGERLLARLQEPDDTYLRLKWEYGWTAREVWEAQGMEAHDGPQ